MSNRDSGEAGITVYLTDQMLKDFLDWQVEREADKLGRGEKCPRCGVRGYGLYQEGFCSRCAYHGGGDSDWRWRDVRSWDREFDPERDYG